MPTEYELEMVLSYEAQAQCDEDLDGDDYIQYLVESNQAPCLDW